MFFVGKKIVYLSLYREGEKIKPVGFLQLTGAHDNIKIAVQLKDMKEIQDAGYRIVIHLSGEEVPIGNVIIKEGKGRFEKEFGTSGGFLLICGEQVSVEEIARLTIALTETEKICGHNAVEKDIELKAADRNESRELQEREEQAETKTETVKKILCTDKWEQIRQKYNNIHPFGDERIFVSLQLEDLVVLPETYHKLIHNSFLLHSFYNYRHLILGKDYKLGNSIEQCYYLGVPGVFFEREKQVAVMFGFEGFECAGAVDIGKFGYYVREVAI